MSATRPFTIDTNILIYSVDRSDQRKHATATRILRRLAASRGPLAFQCLTEFYRATTRSLKPILQASDAELLVRQFFPAFEVIRSDEHDLREAMLLHQSAQLQFFDALLVATTSHRGCLVLLSEDMHDGLRVGSLTIRNPFAMSDDELSALIS